MIFPKFFEYALNRPVMVSGIFRSGTTILIKLIGTMENVEVSFEPAIVRYIDYAISETDFEIEQETIMMDILKVYFAHEIMLNFHQGRGYNIKPNEYSNIHQFKSFNEVIQRMKLVSGNNEAISIMKKKRSRLAFKNVSTYNIQPCLVEKFLGIDIIEIIRDLFSVASSIKVIGWYSDNEIKNNHEYMIHYPFIYGTTLPYFLEHIRYEDFVKYNENTRIIKVLNCLCSLREKAQEGIITHLYKIKYEELIENPKLEVKKICGLTGLKPTKKTEEMIDTIRKKVIVHSKGEIFEGVPDNDRLEFLDNNLKLGYGENERN